MTAPNLISFINPEICCSVFFSQIFIFVAARIRLPASVSNPKNNTAYVRAHLQPCNLSLRGGFSRAPARTVVVNGCRDHAKYAE